MSRILITGSARGIGLELVRHYLAAGHEVIAVCRDPGKAVAALKDLARLVNVIKMNEKSVTRALDSGWKDFEDALQYFSVIQYKSIQAVVTRNRKDYKNSDLPVFSPQEIVRMIG